MIPLRSAPQGDVGRLRLGVSIIVLVGLVAAILALLLGSARSSGQGEVFVMKADGNEATRLTDGGPLPVTTAWRPVAAPASGLIAFTRSDGIYVMRPDGTGVRPLRLGPVAAQGFALDWSPDGRRLAFLADSSIWVMDADGSDAVRLTARSKKSSDDWFTAWSSPTWSPDGRRIAYSYGVGGEKRDVWVMNADGSSKRRLARTPDCSEVDVDWSPKGDQLVTTCVWGWGTRDLRLMNADGSAVSSLLAHGDAYQPDWSPDGRRIAFVRQGDIYVVAVDGGSQVRLTRNGEAEPNYTPVWSPDGRRIAFVCFDEHRVLDFLRL